MLKCVLRESREEFFLIQEKSKAAEVEMGLVLVLQPTIKEFVLALH
jgi:hypothetical protein